MTLLELSAQYRAEAVAIKARVRELTVQRDHTWVADRGSLDARIVMLGVMWRQCRDMSVLTARYYDRGYHRNERYTV